MLRCFKNSLNITEPITCQLLINRDERKSHDYNCHIFFMCPKLYCEKQAFHIKMKFGCTSYILSYTVYLHSRTLYSAFTWNSPSLRSADKVGRPFCFCSVFFFLFLLLRFPTLVGNLSVFVLSFILYSFLFFIVPLHRPAISPSTLYGFTRNFQDMIIMTRLYTVWILGRIPLGVGTGRGPKVEYTL